MDLILKEVAEKASVWLPRLCGALLILISSRLLAQMMQKLITRAMTKANYSGKFAFAVERLPWAIFVTLGTVCALGTLGVDVSALVAGLGLTGLTLGFALKDTLSNLFSGILINLYGPFSVGDYIKFDVFEGKVLKIDLRYTALQTPTDTIFIPNASLYSTPVVVRRPPTETSP